MKIAAYTHLHRAWAPTGVGHHLIRMVRGLHERSDVSMTVVAPRNQLDSEGHISAQHPLAGIPVRGLPLGRRWLEIMWQQLNLPKADPWCEGADWVYTPTEAYVAVKRPRLAVTVHDLHAFETDLPWSNTPEHQAFRSRQAGMFRPIIEHADCILTVSQFTQQRIVELLGIKPERIAVVGNGVDRAYFDTPADGASENLQKEPYIVVVGGLTQRKGGDLVLKVAELLRREAPTIRIMVVGNGEPAFDRQAEALPNIQRLGFVETTRIVGLLRGAIAMMFLSRYEGFGIPVVEAMAAGTPVIASSWSALPEVAGDAGLLVDAENTCQVVAAIRMLSTDAAARRELCALGKKRAENYRWDGCVERLVAALRSR
jgi:glycosyltransferase involved in cell wall biosynthesis